MSFNYLTPKAETRKSGISNYGTFAVQKIAESELIAIFGGFVMDTAAVKALPEKARHMVLQIDDHQFIGSRKEEEFGNGDYINHSCEPNTGLNGQIFLIAMRDIATGEEITFDYCMTISDDLFARMECCCRTTNCRKIITCNDWKLPELQKKYQGYFSHYLQQKIGTMVHA
jgi:Proteins containing SET domain